MSFFGRTDEQRIGRLRADLANLDASIRLLTPGAEPGLIAPTRAYKRTRYFARNELSRLALDIMRKAPGPLAAREIGATVYVLKPDKRDGEPPHWLCPNCYQQRKKRILQGRNDGWMAIVWSCPECKATIFTTTDASPK